VDSSVTLALSIPVLGNRLLPFIINTGALRENELVEIQANVVACGAAPKVIDESQNFFSVIGDAIDAEIKRERFQSVYGPCFDREGKAFGAIFAFQGTNRADKIESGKDGESTLIKSHHNMAEMELIKYNPLEKLFKYEIRAIARLLGLPESISERMPFPGPGLFLRVNGIPATPERIAIVRWADVIATLILREHNILKEISQYTTNLNGVPTVGIKGDGRAYKYSIVIHPVVTMDFMTSIGYQIPDYIRKELTREIRKHPEIIRVLFDEGDKPPASTEWE
jgi:GMP synthase (glutamine-hydrolysing)